MYYAIVHKKSTMYYPQVNGLAKSTNITSRNILKKMINENQIGHKVAEHVVGVHDLL